MGTYIDDEKSREGRVLAILDENSLPHSKLSFPIEGSNTKNIWKKIRSFDAKMLIITLHIINVYIYFAL